MTKKATFDFGNLTAADMTRLASDAQQGGYAGLRMDHSPRDPAIRNDFLDYLKQTLAGLGLLSKGAETVRLAVGVDVNVEMDRTETMRRLWDARAADWPVVETPVTYAITFETLVEHFNYRAGEKQTLLSLGSGPGLYETYLAIRLSEMPNAKDFRIICVDAAPKMTQMNQRILKMAKFRVGRTGTLRSVRNVEAVTGDMTALQFAPASMNHIFCNNALQWVPDWKKAIAEMARVMKPDADGSLYLFVHRHAMVVTDTKGEVIFKSGEFSIEELLDRLEATGYHIQHLRQIASPQGGQFGQRMDRVFVHAKYLPATAIESWRDRQQSVHMRAMRA